MLTSDTEPSNHVTSNTLQTWAGVLTLSNPNDYPPLEELERLYILNVLASVGGCRTKAARILGVHRKTIYRKLERYGMTAPGGSAGMI